MLVDVCGGGYPPELIRVVVGDVSGNLLALRERSVESRSSGSIELVLDLGELRAIYAALAFSYLNRFSEEAFHDRYGFFSENIQAVGLAICSALREM
jgi:hypothetical protein